MAKMTFKKYYGSGLDKTEDKGVSKALGMKESTFKKSPVSRAIDKVEVRVLNQADEQKGKPMRRQTKTDRRHESEGMKKTVRRRKTAREHESEGMKRATAKRPSIRRHESEGMEKLDHHARRMAHHAAEHARLAERLRGGKK